MIYINTEIIKMALFTEEQLRYINYDKIEDTRLIAVAGAGKTKCIIERMNMIIKSELLLPNEILMLTFSKFTRDDFINKIKNSKSKYILESQVSTIDSFAKHIIDENNEVDVSLLSYKLMEYLENTEKEIIQQNKKLNKIKFVLVDEAQDLNETQYKILMGLKNKNNTIINLIGDPNQNIYQFRKSSDKFLMDFNVTTFNLTKNFRSYDPIIQFSKYLRPNQENDIVGHLGKSNCLPNIIFHEDDKELEKHLISILKNAKHYGFNYSEIAILAPTRGRMVGYGRSHGLCLISNLLYKNKIKFKQFYEESTEEQQMTGIKYIPEKNHVNILTFMGSKGLEWKFVILIDVNICLINKRTFSEEKHKHDQYLLYVATSRAIENMVIFSKYKFCEGNLSFQLNPWFNPIPKENYVMDKRLTKFFKFPLVKVRETVGSETRVTKILDKLDEKTLDKLAKLCKYETISQENRKVIKKIYDKDFSLIMNSNIFLGRYIENLFFVYYFMKNNKSKKRYIDIENIINKRIITDVSILVTEWYYQNKNSLTWNEFDKNIELYDKIIVDTINNKFNRDQPLEEHTIVNDGYFKSFILSLRDKIESNYKKYLTTSNTKKIKTYLFNIMIILYSLDTQHYFHALNDGKKFKNILTLCDELFNKVKYFAFNTNIVFDLNNVLVNSSDLDLLGEIDILTNDGIIWEIKCTSDISLKHVLQVIIYNILHNKLYLIDTSNVTIHSNFLNFLKGEQITYKFTMTKNEITEIYNILKSNTTL